VRLQATYGAGESRRVVKVGGAVPAATTRFVRGSRRRDGAPHLQVLSHALHENSLEAALACILASN
jgi:hypothetical protein